MRSVAKSTALPRHYEERSNRSLRSVVGTPRRHMFVKTMRVLCPFLRFPYLWNLISHSKVQGAEPWIVV